jgi:hypothetical protein
MQAHIVSDFYLRGFKDRDPKSPGFDLVWVRTVDNPTSSYGRVSLEDGRVINIGTGVVVGDFYAPHHGRGRSVADAVHAFEGTMSLADRAVRTSVKSLVRELAGSRRASKNAETAMAWLEVIFPKRVASEEIGDALELIHRLESDPACRHRDAKIYVKVVSTVLCLLVNSVRYVASSMIGKNAE